MNFSANIVSVIEDIVALKDAWSKLYNSLPENTLFFSSWEYVNRPGNRGG